MRDAPSARDKRHHPRAQVSMYAQCEPADGDPFAGRMVEVGLGGARIECPQVPAFGATLHITVHFPTASKPSRLPATVRWTQSGCLGVQFGPLGVHDTRLIAALVAAAVREPTQA